MLSKKNIGKYKKRPEYRDLKVIPDLHNDYDPVYSPIMFKLRDKKNWDIFVENMVGKNIRLYAKKHENYTPEIEKEICEVVKYYGDKIWAIEKGKITRWGLGHIFSGAYNYDNPDNASPIRLGDYKWKTLLSHIENCPEYSDYFLEAAIDQNCIFNPTIKYI